jgi:hypothetical protein
VRTSLNKIRKLKSTTAVEVKTRLSQKIAAFSERAGVSSDIRLPSNAEFLANCTQPYSETSLAEDLLHDFRSHAGTRFFTSLRDSIDLRECLNSVLSGEDNAALIGQAESVLSDRFSLLGFRDLSFGEPIDWHAEPVGKRSVPKKHWSRIDFLDPEVAGDKKIVWELNRHQYFQVLGRAYALTGDERYAECFLRHLSSWMEANQPKLGINWTSSLEIAFRSISWVWAFYMFRDSPLFTAEMFLRAMKFLYLNGRHLETYLSTYFSPNTHLTGEALGLFHIGACLPQFNCSPGWVTRAETILGDELKRQILSDGVYFERASYYHRYTTDFYLHFVTLSHALKRHVPQGFKAALNGLADHLMHITRPDGTSPFFGDDDGGKLAMLDERPSNDFRNTLSTASVLLLRGDLKLVAGGLSEETIWLLGPEAKSQWDDLPVQMPSEKSRAFADGGFYVMREDWKVSSDWMMIDGGPHGVMNCGHAHADALSIECAVNGDRLIVDPGTYTYTGSVAKRNYYRSAAAHNSVVVDGESPSRPGGGPFQWRSKAHAVTDQWFSHPKFDIFSGKLGGLIGEKRQAFEHQRNVLFIRSGMWFIHDRLMITGTHQVRAQFNFDPSIASGSVVDGQLPAVVRVSSGGQHSVDMIGFGGEWRIEDALVSNCYGREESSRRASLAAETSGPHQLYTLLYPSRHGGPVQMAECNDGVFGIALEGAFDVVAHKPIGDAFNLKSDFEWSWLRFSTEGNLESFVLVNGSRLTVSNREIVTERRLIDYAVGSRLGGDIIIEFSDGRRHMKSAVINPDVQLAAAL